jgi:ribosomal protein S18 acetylase RimI-like enzyme
MDSDARLFRAWSFERAMQDLCAAVRREFEYGTAIFNDELRRVYDTNFVRFERGFHELTAEIVEAAADELQASLPHRKVMIPDEAAGARVADGLKAKGWRFHTLTTMAYEGPREREPVDGVEEVEPEELRDARQEGLIDGTRDPDARRQIVAYTELMAGVFPTRLVAARAGGGEIGSFCALFQHDRVGQIEEVTTIERHRRRGLGDRVVGGALNASLASGDELTFLVADEGDWPKDWYARLGFVPIGRRFELVRV